jgi:predicted O-methyltransferase YrrM
VTLPPVEVLFRGMEGDSRASGSQMSAHMPSLFLLAREFSFVGDVVELGVGRGWSSLALLMGLGEGTGCLHSYDPHPPILEGALKSFESVGLKRDHSLLEKWKFKQQFDHVGVKDWKDESIGLLFVDSLHGYEGMRDTLKRWLPKVHPRGMIAGHDWFLEEAPGRIMGVKPAVTEFHAAHQDRWRLHVQPHDQGIFMLWPRSA